jgi:hypothetical protein
VRNAAARRRFCFALPPFALPFKQAHTSGMQIFKCPHCSADYEFIMTHLSFRQRSYATCQVCWKAMYRWDRSRVPHFKLLVQPDNTRAQN